MSSLHVTSANWHSLPSSLQHNIALHVGVKRIVKMGEEMRHKYEVDD